MAIDTVLPAWAKWQVNPAFDPWTVGIEEEVLQALPPELSEHARGETHGLALELATQPHSTVADACAELRTMRAGLNQTVRSLGIRAAVAGTHPLVRAEEVEVSPGARYQFLHQSLRELARR